MNEEPTIHQAAEPWQSEATNALFQAILQLETVDEAAAFFRDLCTLGELHDMAQRWAVVRLLDAGLHYGEVSTLTGASTATITRIAQWLHHGQGGYRRMLDRTESRPRVTDAPNDLPGANRRRARAATATSAADSPARSR